MIGGRFCRPNHHRSAKTIGNESNAQNKSGFVEGDEDTCCVQAFTKSTRFATSDPFVLRFDAEDQSRSSPLVLADGGLAVPRSSKGIAAVGDHGGMNGKRVGTSSSDGGILNSRVGGGIQGEVGRGATALGKKRLAGPVFYRVAWRRTGEKTLVWKITSR